MISFENEFVSYSELYQAYLDCRKRKRRTVNSALFEMNEEANLYRLWIDLNRKTYTVGRSIVFVVDRPVKREVFAADFRDRIVHHLIINRLMPSFEREFDDDAYSCRVGKGTDYGVMRCKQQIEECSENYTKEAFILKCDLKSFFMSIDKPRLYGMLLEFIEYKVDMPKRDKDYILWLLSLVIYDRPQDHCVRKQSKAHWRGLPKNKSLFFCNPDKGLPIGNLTSQIFANYYLSWFDKWIREDMGLKYYGRYVDDFYIISTDKKELLNLIEPMKKKLGENGIMLHPKKIYIQEVKKGVKFIGTVIRPNRLHIVKRTVGNAWDATRKICRRLQYHPGDKGIIAKAVSVVNSYLGFLMHKDTYRIRKKIIFFEHMNELWKYCYYNEKYTKITAYKEYCDGCCNLNKHLSSDFYDIINRERLCIQKTKESMRKQENT